MSRYADWDGDEDYNNSGALWEKRAELALRGKRGRKALAELLEALRALPEKRLIEGALCTVGLSEKVAALPATRIVTDWKTSEPTEVPNYEREVVEGWIQSHSDQPEGVCAVGAFLWYRKVKAGLSPEEAFAELPTLLDAEAELDDTARAGKEAGLAYTLAWELAYKNDESFASMTPERRYEAFVSWIEEELRRPPLQHPNRRRERPPRPPRATPRPRLRGREALPEPIGW